MRVLPNAQRQWASTSWHGHATGTCRLASRHAHGPVGPFQLGSVNGYIQRNTPFRKNAINKTDTALKGTQPTNEQTALVLKEISSMRAGGVEVLRCENERLRMALGLQGASGATIDDRLRNILATAVAPVGSVPAQRLGMASAEPAVAEAPLLLMETAGSKRPAGELPQENSLRDRAVTRGL